MKKIFVLVAVLALAALTFMPAPTVSSQGRSQEAKSKFRKKEKPVANQYIVVLNDYAADPKGEDSLAGYIANDLARAQRRS